MFNLDKSQITFSPNVNNEDQDMIMNLFGIDESNNVHDNYLGLPSFVGKNKKATFQMLKDKVWKKLQAWEGKLFSVGGREVLIKAVAQATSTYAMSVFQDSFHSMPRNPILSSPILVGRFGFKQKDSLDALETSLWTKN